MHLLSAVLIFVSTLWILLGTYSVVRGRRATIENRLRRVIIDPIQREKVETIFVSGVDRKRRRRREARGLQRYVIRTEDWLLRAGLHLRAREFLLVVLSSVLLSAVLIYLVSGTVLYAVFGMTAGLIFPFVYVNSRIQARQRLLNTQVADMILLMSNGLKAGHSLIQVMEGVSREVPEPLSEHLRTFLRNTIMGMPMNEALTKLELLSGDEDLSLVITAILIQYQVGGNLAEILDNISLTIRERIRLKKEVQAITAQGRLSAIVISLLPVGLAVLLTLISPEFLLILLQEPVGWMMVGMALCLQMVGIAVFRRIVNIKV